MTDWNVPVAEPSKEALQAVLMKVLMKSMKVLMKSMKYLAFMPMVVSLIGCATAVPDQMVKDQVKSCVEKRRNSDVAGSTPFGERFVLQDVAVKDRKNGDGEAKIIVTLHIQLKDAYRPDAGDEFWKGLLGDKPGAKGEVLSNDLETTFREIDSGWQISCPW